MTKRLATSSTSSSSRSPQSRRTASAKTTAVSKTFAQFKPRSQLNAAKVENNGTNRMVIFLPVHFPRSPSCFQRNDESLISCAFYFFSVFFFFLFFLVLVFRLRDKRESEFLQFIPACSSRISFYTLCSKFHTEFLKARVRFVRHVSERVSEISIL